VLARQTTDCKQRVSTQPEIGSCPQATPLTVMAEQAWLLEHNFVNHHALVSASELQEVEIERGRNHQRNGGPTSTPRGRGNLGSVEG
jgi:hypothetical protein